jgi:anaerobic dimethyl sulfoxide reductase subunit B
MEDKTFITCDTKKCVECHACEAACKAINGVEPGVKLRWVETYWEGDFPDVVNFSRSIGCYHCEDAPCVDTCPVEAINQDSVTRVVTVNSDKCEGNQSCFSACPYEVPQFGKDGKMQKCDLCFNLSNENEFPVCVQTCPSVALTLHRNR